MNRRIILALSCMALTNMAHAADPDSDAARGQTLYRIYCTQCHGVEGDGYGINVADMEVLPRDHTETKEMKTRTDKDLFKAIKFGGKAIDKSVLMPNWDGNLSDQQIQDLVKYLRVLCCTQAAKPEGMSP